MSFFLITMFSDSSNDVYVEPIQNDLSLNGSFMSIFTCRHAAEDSVSLVGGEADWHVEEVEPIELLKRLVRARERKVTHVAIDPKRDNQLKGSHPPLLALEDAYQVHADILMHLEKEIGATATTPISYV